MSQKHHEREETSDQDLSSSDVSVSSGRAQPTITSFASFLQKTSAAILSSVGLIYVFGFIVVNSSLTVFGVYTLDLAQSRYLSAGLCFMLFFLLAGGYLSTPIGAFILGNIPNLRNEKLKVESSLQRMEQEIAAQKGKISAEFACSLRNKAIGLRRRYYRTLGVILVHYLGVILVHWLLITLLMYGFLRIPRNAPPAWFVSLHWTSNVLASSFLIKIAENFLRSRFIKDLEDRKEQEAVALTISAFLLAILLIYLSAAFGHLFYLNVSPSLGGGDPPVVRFVGREDKISTIQQLVPPEPDEASIESQITQPLLLLHETQSSYIVTTAHFRMGFSWRTLPVLGTSDDMRFILAARIGKELVAGVQYMSVPQVWLGALQDQIRDPKYP